MKWKKALAVINPRAGRWGSEKAVPRLLRFAFEKNGGDLVIRTIAGSQDARIWATHAAGEGFDLIIVSGGDGTIHETVNGFLRSTPLPIAIVPTGSGNLLARELGIPKKPKSAIRLIHAGGLRSIDVGAMTSHDRVLLNALTLGYGSRIIADARKELKNLFGYPAYILTALRHMIRITRAKFHCVIDGVEKDFDAQMVMLANVGLTSLRLRKLGPRVLPDDGRFNLILFRHRRFQDLLSILAGIALPHRKPSVRLASYLGKTFTLTSQPSLPLLVDGEACESGTVTVEVRPRAAVFLVPEKNKNP